MAKTVLTGQRLTADLLNSMQPTFVIKQANESLTSNTTFQNDDELTIGGAAGTWFVELDLIMTAANAGAAGTGDVKTSWVSTGTLTPANRKILGTSTDTGSADNSMTSRYGVHSMTTSIPYRARSGGSQFHVYETAQFVATTAWTITLQWAQSTSSATAMTVIAGSFFKAERQEN